MHKEIIETITSPEGSLRDRSVEELLGHSSRDELVRAAEGLEIFRHVSDNLYQKVRTSLFLSTLYRFYLVDRDDVRNLGQIPFEGVRAALKRDYDEAIEIFRSAMLVQGLNKALLSALAEAYYHLAFKYLADQVKRSISQSPGNHLLFLPPGEEDVPFRAREEAVRKDPATGRYPVGVDFSPVRADPCHSGWSDIFFLGMDFPSGARVINLSVDLARRGQGEPAPPIEVYLRRIDESLIRLVSLDLECSKDVEDLGELFNFGNDHLGLLKAGVVASGVIPPYLEDSPAPLASLLERFLGAPGGFELVTRVKGLPKGSRLAVSTTLLCAIITRLMRFSGQTRSLDGPLTEAERRMVASRAILGEWLGGSGGGWQDSGGIWPGIKVIEGVEAAQGDPEFGISNGRLLPAHHVLAREQLSEEAEERLARSMVMVHGGLSQNVGPVLEMVTEKYLLRSTREWLARLKGHTLFSRIVESIKKMEMKELGHLVSQDWENTTKVIIPWATNAFTEDLIARVKARFQKDYYGFLMLGGMAGGGMAFIVNPEIHDSFADALGEMMLGVKENYGKALPFAMDPVVFDFKINYQGIMAEHWQGEKARLPEAYYQAREARAATPVSGWDESETEKIKTENGFSEERQAALRQQLKSGAIGTGKNRLPRNTRIEDIGRDQIQSAIHPLRDPARTADYEAAGRQALQKNQVAVVTFSGGLGSRWTEGAAVVKPINPFVQMAGRHRSFTEIHLAKSSRAAEDYGTSVQHVFTTSYLTHDALAGHLKSIDLFGRAVPVYLSRAKTLGHRVYPMERDLRFLWDELPQQMLDEQQQKVQDSYRQAIIQWAREKGEGEDYLDNLPVQRFHPPGHWYEIPNLIRNGTLARLLKDNSGLTYLLAHNTDTLGAWLDPVILGMHLASEKALTFEVTPRRFEDRGGGLARINGQLQLLESLALPREEDEYKLSYYNTLTNWITVDGLLELFGLTRQEILDGSENPALQDKIDRAVDQLEDRMPTYVTLKEVKRIWGAGQEDLFPVAQFEKLWGDMSRLENLAVHFISVSRRRGQQLKEPAQLDRWVRDGSCKAIEDLAAFKRR